MITTSGGAFVLEDSSQRQYNGCSLICEPTYFEQTAAFSVRLRIIDSFTDAQVDEWRLSVTSSLVDSQSGSGSQETAPWFDALQKAVTATLSAISANSGVTFTVV